MLPAFATPCVCPASHYPKFIVPRVETFPRLTELGCSHDELRLAKAHDHALGRLRTARRLVSLPARQCHDATPNDYSAAVGATHYGLAEGTYRDLVRVWTLLQGRSMHAGPAQPRTAAGMLLFINQQPALCGR